MGLPRCPRLPQPKTSRKAFGFPRPLPLRRGRDPLGIAPSKGIEPRTTPRCCGTPFEEPRGRDTHTTREFPAQARAWVGGREGGGVFICVPERGDRVPRGCFVTEEEGWVTRYAPFASLHKKTIRRTIDICGVNDSASCQWLPPSMLQPISRQLPIKKPRVRARACIREKKQKQKGWESMTQQFLLLQPLPFPPSSLQPTSNIPIFSLQTPSSRLQLFPSLLQQSPPPVYNPLTLSTITPSYPFSKPLRGHPSHPTHTSIYVSTYVHIFPLSLAHRPRRAFPPSRGAVHGESRHEAPPALHDGLLNRGSPCPPRGRALLTLRRLRRSPSSRRHG